MPFVGLLAFDVMWTLVVVAARGKDLLEFPKLFGGWGAGDLKGIVGSSGV